MGSAIEPAGHGAAGVWRTTTHAPPALGSAVEPAGHGAVCVTTQTSGLLPGLAIEPAGQAGGGGGGAHTAPCVSTLDSASTMFATGGPPAACSTWMCSARRTSARSPVAGSVVATSSLATIRTRGWSWSMTTLVWSVGTSITVPLIVSLTTLLVPVRTGAPLTHVALASR